MKHLLIMILILFVTSCATISQKSKPPICNFTIVKIDDTNYKICEAELKEFFNAYLLYYDGEKCTE